MPLRTLAQRCKRLTPLLAAPAALLLSQGQAKAVLTYNIFESGGNVVVQTSGSLVLSTAPDYEDDLSCFGRNGFIRGSNAELCTGTDIANIPAYYIKSPSGQSDFGFPYQLAEASSVSGIFTAFSGNDEYFVIDPAYQSGDPIVSSATFNGQTLASLKFTTMGLIGTWYFVGTPSESIQVIIGPPAGESVPGPLPLLGASAAFGWSRRLRKRIAAPLITPPQA